MGKKGGKLSSPRDLSPSKGTAGSEANLNLNSLTCFLLQKQMFLWLEIAAINNINNYALLII